MFSPERGRKGRLQWMVRLQQEGWFRNCDSNINSCISGRARISYRWANCGSIRPRAVMNQKTHFTAASCQSANCTSCYVSFFARTCLRAHDTPLSCLDPLFSTTVHFARIFSTAVLWDFEIRTSDLRLRRARLGPLYITVAITLAASSTGNCAHFDRAI